MTGFYGRQVLPRLLDVACGARSAYPRRMRVWVFGGCHLTRRIPELVESAGFEITSLDTFYEEGSPKFLAATSLGVAVAR